MKKQLIFTLISLIISSLLYCQTKFSTALKIGDVFPELIIEKAVNMKKGIKSFKDLRGKAVILDFWAPWCAPCIKNFPLIDSLQHKFDNQLVVLPVTTEDSAAASTFLKNYYQRNGLLLPSIVGDSTLVKYVDHRVIPHYVWIDKNGIIKGFTGTEEVNGENISKLIAGEQLNLSTKIDRSFSENAPFFMGNQWKYSDYPDKFLYNSILTKYNKELRNGAYRGNNFIDCPNHPIKQLYQIAFGMFRLNYLNDNILLLEGFKTLQDSLAIGVYDWTKHRNLWKDKISEYSFCYELAFTDSVLNMPYMFKIMQDDLNKYFGLRGINGKCEKRKTKVMALVRTSKELKYLAQKDEKQGGTVNGYSLHLTGVPIARMIEILQSSYYTYGSLPIEDHTGIIEKISISIDTDLKDLQKVNKELEKYDLQFVEKLVEKEMIILSKTSNNPTN
jgi:thiol-disulfide isomerase/thioredoxin